MKRRALFVFLEIFLASFVAALAGILLGCAGGGEWNAIKPVRTGEVHQLFILAVVGSGPGILAGLLVAFPRRPRLAAATAAAAAFAINTWFWWWLMSTKST